jgi:hypothetical protein
LQLSLIAQKSQSAITEKPEVLARLRLARWLKKPEANFCYGHLVAIVSLNQDQSRTMRPPEAIAELLGVSAALLVIIFSAGLC